MHSENVFAINDGFYTFVLLFLQSKSPRPHFRRALSKTSFTVLFDRDEAIKGEVNPKIKFVLFERTFKTRVVIV